MTDAPSSAVAGPAGGPGRPGGTAALWAALGGDPALTARVAHGGPPGVLPARLPVRELARAAVAVCSLAAAERAARGTGGPVPAVRVDDGAVATAFVSERHLTVGGRAPVAFAPLSGFWRAADGWVRTHANYPHHRAALLAALDTDEGGMAAALAERPARAVEEEVYAAGGLAVAVRTPREWAAHPQGVAAGELPLVVRERLDDAPPPDRSGRPLRVLDLTRVIAGPVATRTLALFGADVLRLDPPRLPELPDQHADTGFGKRSATLDLARAGDRRAFGELLDRADVLVTGYRPGALERFGPVRPGLVVARLSAWGDGGPWDARRGFDSLVQAASGIAVLEGTPERPGALPAQALDHATGYLLAAAVLRAVTDQDDDGGTRLVRLALARTAHFLVHGLPRAPEGDGGRYEPGRWLAERDGPLGRLRYALPPVGYAGGPADWARPPGVWGADAPVWRTD
ncbi:CoA transferase [Streptomyces sp. NPDC049910]|uniref:CoA transferase n=1 Tax=Streptomyces sp. NPDC049910 TaxID=3155278 RepID=UPI00341D3061